MQDNDAVNKRLEKDYRKVVEKVLECEAETRKRHHLFDKNKEAIKASIKKSLENHAFNLKLLDQETEATKTRHEEDYQTTLKAIDKKEKDAQASFKQSQKDLEKTLEEKKELSRMKEQKSQTDYDFALKKATEVKLDIQKKADEAIDEAVAEHNRRVSDLERETNIRSIVNANRLELRRLDFNRTYKTIKASHKDALDQKTAELKKAEKDFKTALKERMKTHEKTMRPLNKAIDTLRAKQDKALDSLKKKQEEELSKHQSYRNEAKKLNDTTQLNKIEKTLKQLKKDHEDTLKKTKDQQQEALRPRIEERDSVLASEQEAITVLKQSHLEAIEEALYAIEKTKSDEKIAIDDANKTYNQAVAEYDQGKQAIRIDHDVQMLNFDQARDEIELDRTHEKTVAQPKSDLKENEAALKRDKEGAERTASDKTADALYTLEKTKGRLDNDLTVQGFERDRNEARYIKDHALKDTEIHTWLKRYEKDYNHQAMLSEHYMKESENYTALKNDLIKAKRPAVEKEIQSWIKRQSESHEKMIGDAKKDHERMVESIERTYENERAIYQETYDTMVKNHEQIIENMMTEQALERNRAVEEINSLSDQKGKKSKKRRAQLKQALDQKQEAHDEALYKKKKALEKKRAIHERMLKGIEDKRRQSLEEAKTLLYHITDQINTHLSTLGRLSKETTRAYTDLAYSIKHRAHLFRTFQHERSLTTMDSAKDYINTRIHRAKSEKTDNDARKDDYISALNKDYEATRKANEEKRQDAEKAYKDALEAIEKEKADTIAKLEESFKDERHRLELHINKLTKDYEDRKRSLKSQTDSEKENFFEEKEHSERALDEEKERLEKAFESDRESILESLETIRASHQKVLDTIDGKLKEDSIHYLSPSKVPFVAPVLRGEKDVSTLDDTQTT